MKSTVRVASTEPGAVTAEALAAARALDAVDPAGVLLGYYPVANTNPFARLLYQRAWEAGIAPLPVSTEAQFAELADLARLGHRVVLHLHWLNRPLGSADTPEAASASGREFLARLDEVHAAGGRIAWTVHNLLPHDARFEDEECRFRGAVAQRVDVIHVMASATPELVRPFFTLPPDRILHVPHPNYIGAYADFVSRGQARHDLGIMPDELVYLVLGGIRPYKGIGELLDAWDELPDDGTPRRLVIAGRPTGAPGIEALLDRAAFHPGVLLHPERIDADAMQQFLRASDVAVLPYLRSLNSGALMLAMSFDLPVIVPASGFAEIVDVRNGIVFQGGDHESLVDALRRAPEIATPAGRAAAGATARRFDAAALSRQFVDGLRERLGWG
jgi:glycosyltransferase involved in cell wall biosynthesis